MRTQSPIYDQPYLTLPRDRKELHQWCRHYYLTNFLVRNIIDLHATYPMLGMEIQCADQKQKDFFESMCKDIDLLSVVHELAKEFWKLGDTIVFAELAKDRPSWEKLYLINPDIAQITNTLVGRVVVFEDKELNPFNVSIISHIKSEYDQTGESIIMPCIKALMLNDELKKFGAAEENSHLFNSLVYGKDDGTLRDTEFSYKRLRYAIRHWIEYKLFKPIVEMDQNGFVEPVTVSWPKLNLESDSRYLESLSKIQEYAKIATAL